MIIKDIRELVKLLLKELILSKEVFLVAHNNMDLDAYAAMVGFSLIAKKYNNKVYLISDDKEIDPATALAMENISSKITIITSEEAKSKITKRSVLYVLDTNKLGRICVKDMISLFKTITVIDHHTKVQDSIPNANIYIDEKATSASEIVTSLINKLRVKLPKNYATVLLGGIVLDTNNFVYKMTRKAFYYCYFLSVKGADVEEAQLYFKQDLQEYVDRSKMIASTKINGEIAIATGVKGRIYKSQDLAKVADLLLEFKGIKTSFAIGYLDENKVGISTRSIKNINAGKLMEEFGGGGNKVEAAAVIENTNIKKVEELLEEKLK